MLALLVYPLVRLLLIASIACMQSGCVSSKYATTQRGPATPLELQGSADPLKTTIAQVVVRHGPGSWKREAFWDEYQLSLVNRHSSVITITALRLVDAQGSNVDSGDNWYALETNSRSAWSRAALQENVELGARVVAVGIGRAAAAVGMASAYLALHGLTIVAPGAAALAIPAVTERMHDANKAKEREITDEFESRRIHLPAALPPGGTMKRSAFFPITPAPQRLVIQYQVGPEIRQVAVDLAPLADFHANGGMTLGPIPTPLAPLTPPSI